MPQVNSPTPSTTSTKAATRSSVGSWGSSMPQSIPAIRGPTISESAVPKATVPRIQKPPKVTRARVRAPTPRAPTASSAPVMSKLASPRANAVRRSLITPQWYPRRRHGSIQKRDDPFADPGLVLRCRVNGSCLDYCPAGNASRRQCNHGDPNNPNVILYHLCKSSNFCTWPFSGDFDCREFCQANVPEGMAQIGQVGRGGPTYADRKGTCRLPSCYCLRVL